MSELIRWVSELISLYFGCLNVYLDHLIEVRDSALIRYVVPGRDGPGALPNGESCWDVAAAVTWKLRSTFRPGSYIWSFTYGFGVVVRDTREWRPGFYTEFRCASRDHDGLAWGAIFEKVIQNQEIHTF